MDNVKLVPFLNYQFSVFEVAELRDNLLSGTFDGKSIHFIAASTFFGRFQGKSFREIWNDGILISDSRPLSRYLRFFNSELVQIRGTDFMRIYLSEISCRAVLIGSTPDVTNAIKNIFEKINPGLVIVKTFHPQIHSDKDFQLIEWSRVLGEHKADVVWIALGSPKQDYVAQKLAKEFHVPVIAVGAAFDFLSDSKSEANSIVKRLYLEWAFRLLSEPRRLWKRYLLGNLKFIFLIFLDLLQKNLPKIISKTK
jgi:N-acetylglucosaminyldiphosphoundecaprenol N-acetyl-beta-D-mannosaminyltransferase